MLSRKSNLPIKNSSKQIPTPPHQKAVHKASVRIAAGEVMRSPAVPDKGNGDVVAVVSMGCPLNQF